MKVKFLTSILVLSVLFSITRDSYGWNQSPEAHLEVLREYAIVGRRAILDGNDPCNPSYDPDGYITRYDWDFTNNSSYDYYETAGYYPDGAFDGKTTYIYDTNGTYQVKLRVKDDGDPAFYDTDTCTVYVCLDEDGDDLPDDWEDVYDLNDANFADADIDSDNDNYNNLCEYLHGSEPNDANSVPSFNITIYVPDDVSCIQRAINASIDGDTIVVSEGTYEETVDFNGVSCTLTSTDPNDWSIVAATIIDANDPNAVVIFENSEDANSVLRGFTITGGDVGIYCDGASPAISNCVIKDNDSNSYGGGIYDCNSAPTVTNCIFSENDANYGGGIYDVNSSPTLFSCVFVGNTADTDGGAMYNYDSSPIIINCTFSENSAAGDGGGMYSYGSSDPNVTNSIFWGNSATGTGDEVYNDGSADPNFSYCDIKGCGGSSGWDPNFGSNDGNNIDSDPNFVDADDPDGPDGIFATFDDGLQLQYLQLVSPCIDAADGNAAPSIDITGSARSDVNSISNTGTGDPNYADIGAYESPMIWFVDVNATGSDDGTSWDDAFDDLQDALADACDDDEIWVSEGTYKPTSGSSRSISFELVEGVGVYGGFAGTEVYRYQRDWILYKTTLSGDIGTVGDQNDNSYHVVKGANNSLLDGFTITGGYANGVSYPDYHGGGIYCSNTSPTISNCTFSENKALYYGGGMYNYIISSPTLTNCIFSENNAIYGGGMYNSASSSPTLTNCIFSGNYANYGSGMDNYGSSPTVINCIFSENNANYGGGMHNSVSSPMLINCTFSGNQATTSGGGMRNYHSSPIVTNCIFWDDDAGSSGDEVYNSGSTDLTISYSDIEGCGGSGDGWDPNFGSDGGGNIDSDPCFLDINDADGADGIFFTVDDGLRLTGASPCIDAANGWAALGTDILGRERVDLNDVNNTGVGNPEYADMGAYESYDGVDTDGDGMPDDWELIHGLDPTNASDAGLDGDEDRLTNLKEYQAGTDPIDADSDDDDLPDGWEVVYGLDPLDSGDAGLDGDQDNLTNLEEYQTGTDPTDADSDNDGIPDGWEVDNGLNPLSDDASGDPDDDGLSNLGEYTNNADPHDADSDNDYMLDGWEVDNWLDPNSDSGNDGSDGNPDSDAYTNLSEYLHESDPNDPNSIPESTTTITVPTEAGSVQSAIDVSIAGDVIEVLPGTYFESIDFDGNSVTVKSSDPNDWWVVESTIIDGNDASEVVLFNSGEDANSVLMGVTLTNGDYGISCSGSSPIIAKCIIEDCNSHGIYCTSSSSPEIRNNMIGVNGGDGIYSSSSTPTIKNNWVYANDDDGIEFGSGASGVTVRNNTIADNTDYGISWSGDAPTITNCIIWDNDDDLSDSNATYSCIKNNYPGPGNIIGDSNDPLFFDANNYDYRLQRTSPCINAGTGTYSDEEDIEGQVRMAKSIDMGADEVCEVHNTTQDQDIWYSHADSEGIQDAINDANNNDVIKVYEWTFYESIDFNDVNVTLTSHDPNNWAVTAVTIIDANDSDANVVTFNSGQDANSILRGFTLTGGSNGVYCANSSSPTIVTCFIKNNSSAGVACISGSPLITRCKVGENSGDGIDSSSTTPPTIKCNLIYKNDANGISFSSATSVAAIRNNSIVDNNDYGIYVSSGTEPNVSNCIVWGHDGNDLSDVNATYSCIEDINDANGTGNITSDPLYINPDSNNYCLDSSSPCVAAGDPNQIYSGERGLYGKILDREGDGAVTLGPIPTYKICVKKGSTPSGAHDTWDTAYGELRNALDPDLDPGIEIWVAQGTYTPAEPFSNNRDATFQLVELMTLKGGYAGSTTTPDLRDTQLYETILSGDLNGDDESVGNSENSYHVVMAEGPGIGESTILDGFTITGGNGELGGGIFCYKASPVISNCLITGNYGIWGAGGMFNWWESSPEVTNCTFSKNTGGESREGGGMRNYFHCSPTVENCVFSENTSGLWGGGMANVVSCSPKVTNCLFWKNSSKYTGGGMYNYVGSSMNLLVTNCVFSENKSDESNGGGMYADHVILTNCTFSKNEALSGDGGGMKARRSYTKTVTNCIFWDNEDSGGKDESAQIYDPDEAVNVTYSDVQGGWDGEGNINQTPEFVDADDPAGPDEVFGTYDDGLRLQSNSPCIDAGHPDYDNSNEPFSPDDSGYIDMGAYGNTTKASLIMTIDLDADTNRDGKVDKVAHDDEVGEDTWSKGEIQVGKGAIVLPNCDDDGSNGAPDNWPGEYNKYYNESFDPRDWKLDGESPYEGNNNQIDGSDDKDDMAELWVYKLDDAYEGLPADLKITLEVKKPGTEHGFFGDPADPVPANHRVRIFRGDQGDYATARIGPGTLSKVELTKADFDGSGKVSFLVEGIEVGAMVDITLTLIDTRGPEPDLIIGSDTVRIRVAPFVLADHTMSIDTLAATDTVYVSDSAYGDDNSDLRINALRNIYPAYLDETCDGTYDPWQQDGYEVGYVKAPYGNMSVFLTTSRAYREGSYNVIAKFVHNKRLAAGVGVCWRLEGGDDSKYNSTGNIECPPSNSGPGGFFFGQDIKDYIEKFFEAQGVNPPLPVNTDWLDAGHVDEVVSFARDGQHTIIADPEVCWGLLVWADSIGQDDAKLTYTTGHSSIYNMIVDNTLWLYNFYTVMAPYNLPSIQEGLDLVSPETVPVADPGNTGTGTLAKGGAFVAMLPVSVEEKRTFKIVFDQGDNLKYSLWYGDDGAESTTEETNAYGICFPVGGPERTYIGRTDGDCIFKNAKCFILFHFWKNKDNIQEGDEFVFEVDAKCKTIEMPVIFRGAQAYTIDHVNCLVDGNTVFTGKTHEENTDNVIKNYVSALFGKVGYYYNLQDPDSDDIIEADSLPYHVQNGDIHCGTNAQRVIPTTYKWWECE